MASNKILSMKNLVPAIIIMVLFGIVSPAWADQGVIVGGYDVVKLASDTISVLESSGMITKVEVEELNSVLPKDQPKDSMMASPAVTDVFDKIGTVLVVKGVASTADIESFNKAATESGGLKIAGRNPVVLAASYLDLLARKGVVSLQKAQQILDSSKQ